MNEGDFNALLKQNGLPASYYFDKELHQKQQELKDSINILDAFRKALPALFTHSEKCVGSDDFYSLVRDMPEQFNLSADAGNDTIKTALQETFKEDNSFKIYLLPENIETERPDGVKLFPPENGEKVSDYWIWFIKTNIFPGPAWLLIKRDGSETAYHYGYM
jgi:hypothetical protein